MMAFNDIHLLHCCILVASVLVIMPCMNATPISSASQMVPNTTVVNRCIEKERQALLMIKRGFVDKLGILSSWGSPQEEDCCQWTGVGCDNLTGHVTHLKLSAIDHHDTDPTVRPQSNLSRSLLELKNLNYLDLRKNDFGEHPIPKFIGSLSNLVYLDLSRACFGGAIPHELGSLSRLNHLDLSGNELTGNLEDILYVLPEDTLQVLLMYGNNLTGSLPDITRFSSLTDLNVCDNQLHGYLPEIFKHRSVLQSLVLTNNYLRGSLPSFTGFSHLKELDLEANKFSGSLPNFMRLQSLIILNLRQNNFSGILPDFTGMQSLKVLHLDYNHFSGSIPDFTGCSSLEELYLEENEITEWKTQSIGQLNSLYLLDLSMNSIGSTITESHLSNLSSLDDMDASSNSLTFNLSSGWLPPFQLQVLSLASCKLGPKFPNWISNQTKIASLDFSYTQIADTIPMWFFNISSGISWLDLSSNKIRGKLSSKVFDVPNLDLSSNNFSGEVPLISSWSTRINLSNNKFSGQLFSLSAVQGMELNFFDCSHNLLSGVLPTTWVHFPLLVHLNIGYNNLSGIIPSSIGYLVYLQTLILRNNSFYGGLPDSLRNCSRLGFADFGLNNLSGKIPEWIGEDLPHLYALILKSNKFYGSMPYHLCHLSNLHFLDMSINKISGTVPQCFGNLSGMIERQIEILEDYNISIRTRKISSLSSSLSSYVDNAVAFWKGQEFEYGRNFAYLKMIDLSTNELTGEIPIGLTRLHLRGLNLSRNKFYGKVPQEIGGLNLLECLDLSRNNFSGEIPQNISGLTFLAYLDLSYNNFSGRIPLGTQLQSFNASVYEMNIGLCGRPLEKICPGDEPGIEVQPSPDGNEAEEDEIEYERWLYISAALGFGTTFWGICGILVLNRRWRHAYFLFLNNMKDRLYVIMAVHIARFRR